MALPTPGMKPALSTDGPSDDGLQRLHSQLLHVSRSATAVEMAAGIGHELNQPLTAIANYAQACERILGLPHADLAEVQEALHQISNEAIRVGDVLHRLRTLTRSQPTCRAWADINAVIREIAGLLGSEALAHHGQLEFELSDGLPQVCIDAVQVQYALFNLAQNGFQACALEGCAAHVLIRPARTADGSIEVAVCDNGPGLTSQALARLFNPFTSTREGRIGLGLSISNTLIRAQDGTLAYRPNVPAGACFFFLLPVDGAEASGTPAS